MDLKKIIQDGYDLGMSQHLYEITSVVSLLKQQNIKDFIEIGTDRGGTFLVWSKISDPNGLKISIDWSHGRWGNNNYDVEKRNQTLKSLGKNVHILDGNGVKFVKC